MGWQSFSDASEHENCGPPFRSEGHVAFIYKADRASGIERLGIENLLILLATRAAGRLIAGLGAGSLLYSGVLDRFPWLTIVLSHGGGAFPYLAGRFDIMHARMDRKAQGDVALRKPSDYAGRFAYDSILHAGRPLRFLTELVGIDRIMLGTDYSFPPADLTPMHTLRQAGFAAQEIEQIAEENRAACSTSIA